MTRGTVVRPRPYAFHAVTNWVIVFSASSSMIRFESCVSSDENLVNGSRSSE
jgi:hypothetical protein